jgi:hypothetical protein
MRDFYLRVLTKYDWAQKHVDKLEIAIDKFRRTNPHTIRREDDFKSGQVTFYVEQVPVIPDDLALMLGDAIHNLRSTLDHMAHALVKASGGTTDQYTAFPIFDDSKGYSALSRGKVPGLREPCYEILDRIQPYKDGWGHLLWQLHRLDIVDKHRLLLTICTKPVGRTMTPSEKAAFVARKTMVGPHTFAAKQYVYAAANPLIIPMQAGYKLGSFAASEVDENMGFAFDMAINEPGIVEGMPSFLLLRNFSSEISRIISDFGPCLA